MEILQLIKSRRSIPRFKADPVDRPAIEMLLEAAVWAPNHHLTEPWHFYVLEDGAKARFAEIRRDFRLTLFPNPQAPEAQKAAQKVFEQVLETPVVIVVTTRVSPDPTLTEDDYAATMMAVQNMLLVAASLDLGAYLRTGGLIHDDALRVLLGLAADRRIAGVVYVGYPDLIPERHRTPAEQKTTWLRDVTPPPESLTDPLPDSLETDGAPRS